MSTKLELFMLRNKSWKSLGRSNKSATSYRGALAIGTSNYPIPSSGIVVYVEPVNGNDSNVGTNVNLPKKTIANALAANPTGCTVVCRAGIYHENITVAPGRGPYAVQAYPGEVVWMDGSSIYNDGWTFNGSCWERAWTTKFSHTGDGIIPGGNYPSGDLDPGYPLGMWPDGLFLDGVRQSMVSTTPTSGQVFFDYTNNKVKIGTDPAGKEVRISDLVQFLTCGGTCSLYGIGVRRYATNVGNLGAVRYAGSLAAAGGGAYGHNTVENCWFIDNGGTGCSFGANFSTAKNCTATQNGGNGFSAYCPNSDNAGGGDTYTWDSCVVSFNNRNRLHPRATSCGGMKIAQIHNVTVKNCLFDRNYQCSAFWSDFNTYNMNIYNNEAYPGEAGSDGTTPQAGFSLELSDTIRFVNNKVDGSSNGRFRNTVSINNTGRSKFYNNEVVGGTVSQFYVIQDVRRNADPTRGGSALCHTEAPWICQSLEFANNVVSGTNELFARDNNDGDANYEGNRTADQMISLVKGNNFESTAVAIAWGTVTGSTTNYSTAAAFRAAWPAYGPNNDNSFDTTNAVGLPSDLAALVDYPVGTKEVGLLT